MDFNENGLLQAGFHDCLYSDFWVTFVDGFPTSQMRRTIADAILDFSEELFSLAEPYEFWIDGSYATSKVNPNDADIVIFLQYNDYVNHYNRLEILQRKYCNTLDFYYAPAVSKENEKLLNPVDYQDVINNRNYWRGQFGYDREDRPKGIIRVSCESIKEYLRRR